MVFGKVKASDLGPTGRFPDGKMHPDDIGELLVGLTIVQNKLVIHFGKPIVWIALQKTQAIEMAEKLIQMAEGLE